jgi:hypothetical protein
VAESEEVVATANDDVFATDVDTTPPLQVALIVYVPAGQPFDVDRAPRETPYASAFRLPLPERL